MGKIIQFPLNKQRKTTRYNFNPLEIRALEQEVVNFLAKRRVIFVTRLLTALGLGRFAQLLLVLARLELKGKLEQPMRGFFRLKERR